MLFRIPLFMKYYCISTCLLYLYFVYEMQLYINMFTIFVYSIHIQLLCEALLYGMYIAFICSFCMKYCYMVLIYHTDL